jgi:hypothetical protein
MSTFVKFLLFLFLMNSDTTTIFDFSSDAIQSWQIINDGVMGGLSESELTQTEKGYGKFSGHVSLANNGGFASVRLITDNHIKPNQSYIILRVKGDGKSYQFRLKAKKSQPESYVQEFSTSGEWQNIRLNINDFSPQFRGRNLNMPNFDYSKIEEVRFLIANKKEEDFELLIDTIELK